MIEIGKRSETRITYEEAVLYCFALGAGWRMPTEKEYHEIDEIEYGWYLDHYKVWPNRPSNLFKVTPVRDLKDD